MNSTDSNVAERTLVGRNRAAKVSVFFAMCAVGFLSTFATSLLCSLAAIPTGHIARFRGRRLNGEGRGLALASILTGWLALVICLLAYLAFLGLVVGLSLLVDSA